MEREESSLKRKSSESRTNNLARPRDQVEKQDNSLKRKLSEDKGTQKLMRLSDIATNRNQNEIESENSSSLCLTSQNSEYIECTEDENTESARIIDNFEFPGEDRRSHKLKDIFVYRHLGHYPVSIKNISDKSRRKIAKRNFRASAKNYSVATVKKSVLSDSLLIHKLKGGKERAVPYLGELSEIFNKIHIVNTVHLNIRQTIEKAIEMNLYWPGYEEDIREFYLECVPCNIYFKRIPKREKKHGTIVSNNPYERFQIDLCEINSILLKNTEYRYLCNVIDHFSRFAWSTLIKTKHSEVVANSVHNILIHLSRTPEIMQSDNGLEFVGQPFQELLSKFNIKHVKSRPYNPKAQGLVERFNRTLKSKLLKIYYTDEVNFDLEEAVQNVLDVYNNTKHSVTRYKPSFVFETESNEVLEIVRERTNARKAYLTNQETFAHLDKVVIPNCMKLSRNNKWLIYQKKQFRRAELL